MTCGFVMRSKKKDHAEGVVSSKAISRALVGVYSNHLPISDASAELAISAFSSSPPGTPSAPSESNSNSFSNDGDSYEYGLPQGSEPGTVPRGSSASRPSCVVG